MRRLAAAALLAGAAVPLTVVPVSLTACSGPPSVLPPRPSLIVERPLEHERVDGARWVFQPASRPTMNARLSLEEGRVLFVGDKGQRWLLRPGDPPEVSAHAAGEDLIDVRHRGETFVFVGSRGTVYGATGPLEVFSWVRPPPERFVSVAAADGVLVGVRRDGTVFRSTDEGLGWRRAKAPALPLSGVVLTSSKVGLGYALPETWFRSDDAGATWIPADLPPLGVATLRRTWSDEIVAKGVLGSRSWAVGGWKEAPRDPPDPFAEVPSPAVTRAGAVAEKRATISGIEYLEARLTEGIDAAAKQKSKRARWTKLEGRLGEPLTERPWPALESCRDVGVARRDSWVVVVCSKEAPLVSLGRVVPLTVLRSDDGGKTFEPMSPLPRAIFADVQVAIGPDGAVLATGVCPPHLSELGCAPRGAVRFDAEKQKWRSLPLPGLTTPEALDVGPTGRVFVAGRRDKDQRITVYIAEAVDAAFRAFDISAVLSPPERSGPLDPEEAELRLSASKQGGATLVHVASPIDRLVATIDDEGRVLSSGTTPRDVAALDAVGRRALAVSSRWSRAWESLDGGATWQLVDLPQAPCGSDSECHLTCVDAGCVVGDELTRLGWGGETPALREEVAPTSEQPRKRSLRTPISCTLEGRAWQPLEGVHSVPGVQSAALGDVAWFGAGFDAERGAAWALHARRGSHQLTQRTLLPAVREPHAYALEVRDQVEGSIALRYRIPRSSRGERLIRGVEVAWDNRVTDELGKASLSESFSPLAGDYQPRAELTQRAQPSLLSVAAEGAYLRLHRAPGHRQPTFHISPAGGRKLGVISWPSEIVREGGDEMVRIDGEDVGLGLLPGSRSVVRADRKDGKWSLRAASLTLSDPSEIGLAQSAHLTYVGKDPGFQVLMLDPDGNWWRAYTVPLSAPGAIDPFGSPRPAPLQLDLSDPPSPCSAQQRSSTARFTAPAFLADPHPILVTHPVEAPQALLTGAAVLYGTPEQPCAAALGASTPEGRAADEAMTALILPDDMQHAWAFREEKRGSRTTAVHYRPMSCRFDPTLTIPGELLESDRRRRR